MIRTSLKKGEGGRLKLVIASNESVIRIIVLVLSPHETTRKRITVKDVRIMRQPNKDGSGMKIRL